jgi:hypothetical protein
MRIAESNLAELKRAYQIIGVPLSASTASIKQAYRRLAKRWHPDLYPSRTSGQDEAAQMMKLINEAYPKIAHAPLRYHIESFPRAKLRKAQTANPRDVVRVTAHRDILPVTDRTEFWVRFGCGALLGAFMSISLVLSFSGEPKVLLFATVGLPVLCGFAAARFGDRFWSKVLEYGWLWW